MIVDQQNTDRRSRLIRIVHALLYCHFGLLFALQMSRLQVVNVMTVRRLASYIIQELLPDQYSSRLFRLPVEVNG